MDLKDSWPAWMQHISLVSWLIDPRCKTQGMKQTADGSMGLNAYCVPNLQLDLLAINVDHARSKLNTDCQVVNRLEPLVCEL